MPLHTPLGLMFAAAMLLASGSASAQAEPLITSAGLCGPMDNTFGPYDYRKHADKHSIVERFHFTPKVESLREGQSAAHVASDIAYTLRAFPNHPRALYAMSRYSQRLNATRVPGSEYPVECWFERAVRFTPDDAQVRALYADYLLNNKRTDEARKQLELGSKLNASPQTSYNLGLAWTRLGGFQEALPLARRAYDGGIKVPGLRDRLKQAGVWK